MKNKILEYYDEKNSLIQCVNCGFVWSPQLKKNEVLDITKCKCPLGCKEEANISK